jgi:3-hydroxyisobutyrate dehydrogenase-like beta-hydroxyacid dehydrogenase
MLAAECSSYVAPPSKADSTFGSGVGTSLLPPVDTSTSSADKPTIAILSFGEMGMGIAALLSKFRYRIITNLDGRSEKTKARAEAIGVHHLPLEQLLEQASIFLSIVPPAEALPLAQKMAATFQTLQRSEGKSLTYLDLNAISPDLARHIDHVITNTGIRFIDGAIIGFPPKEINEMSWFRPAITISGPQFSSIVGPFTEELISVLNVRHVGIEIGAASGLKMCFGAIYKGHAAIVTQAYTTAENLGVLPALRQHMREYFPTITPIIESSLVGSQRKAYRWIKEMEEVEETFVKEGGWSRDLFHGAANVFRIVAHKTTLEKHSKSDIGEITHEICLGLKRTKSL